MEDRKSKLPVKRIITGQADTEVRVLLKMDDVTKKAWVEVGVCSLVRPGLIGWLKVDANSQRLTEDVRRAAELIAMSQCADYSDGHNPPAVARAAEAALKDVMAKADRANKRIVSLPGGGA